jgi:hypothetical protein
VVNIENLVFHELELPLGILATAHADG